MIESLLGMGAPPFQFPTVEFKGSNLTHADSLAPWSKIQRSDKPIASHHCLHSGI
jgi:hypothetical protein